MQYKFSDYILAVSKLVFSKRQSRRYYSQWGEDCVITEFFGRKKKVGFYVDVGCYHPKKHSNTFLLYKRGWRGILVDLEPSKIIACRISRPGDTSILAAVSDQRKTVSIFAPKRFSVMATIKHQQEGDPLIGRIETSTLTSIIDGTRFKDRRIDLLSVDVEGADLEVVRGLDFKRYEPALVVGESHLKSIDQILRSPFHLELTKNGYQLCNWVGLSLFYKPA